jgi:hypothetical protein
MHQSFSRSRQKCHSKYDIAIVSIQEEQIGINHIERTSAAAASLRGSLRASNRRGGGGGKRRNTGAPERSRIITSTQYQSSMAKKMYIIIAIPRRAWAALCKQGKSVENVKERFSCCSPFLHC